MAKQKEVAKEIINYINYLRLSIDYGKIGEDMGYKVPKLIADIFNKEIKDIKERYKL